MSCIVSNNLLSPGPCKHRTMLTRRAFIADGLCAISVISRSGIAVSDKASWYTLAQAVYEVLEQCVKPDSSGGSLKNLGTKTTVPSSANIQR